jgi:deoxyribonuclease-4
MQAPRFDNIPLILETPDESRWAEEIQLLKSFEIA